MLTEDESIELIFFDLWKCHKICPGKSILYLVICYTNSLFQSTCLAVKNYLDETLGRYVVNMTEAAFLCSKELCSFNGRCVRRDPGSSAYLHLDPTVWTILSRAELPELNPNSPSYVIHMNNKFSFNKRYNFTKPFKCQCYPGWKGEHCEKQVPKPGQRK